MSNHPNRSAGHPARNPSPAEVRAAREAAGLTQTQAAALVHSTDRNWRMWEDDTGGPSARRMHPGLWELFQLKNAMRVSQSEGATINDAACSGG